MPLITSVNDVSQPCCPRRIRSFPGHSPHALWPAVHRELLDWTLPGAGPACWDLCWYLALNRARLPEPKEAAISRFRAALDGHGIATASWRQEQLDLCLIASWPRSAGRSTR